MRFGILLLLLITIATSYAQEVGASKPSITVIVSVQNRPTVYLRTTLRALEDLKVAGRNHFSNVQVILTYVGSMDLLARDAISNVMSSRTAYQDFLFINGNPGEGVPHALNRAAKEATGDFLLFIQDTVELLGPEQIQKMIEVFASAKGGTEEVGVVGNKVIEDDGTIYSAGIDFLLAKNPNKPASDPFSSWTQFQAYASSYSAGNSEVNRLIEGIYGRGRYQPNEASGGQDKTNSTDDSKDVLNAPEVPVIFHRMQGYNAHDSRVMSTQDVHAVSKACMMVPRSVFMEAGGFAENYTASYFDVDFCLRLRRDYKKRIIYTPHSISLHHENQWDGEGGALADDNLNSEVVQADLKVFTLEWMKYLEPEMNSRYLINNLTLIWAMDCGTGQVLGFTTEATNLITALHSAIRIKIHVNNEDECRNELKKAGFPVSVRKLMHLLMNRKARANNEETIAVLHKDPGRYAFHMTAEGIRDAAVLIGRSMYETDKIPLHWLNPCENEVDRIWVPSRFNIDTFKNTGVNASKLDTVPETIDVYHFDPQAHEPMKLEAKYDFTFLSISKWEPRKAWDILIKAYFDEFSSERGKVGLFIRASMNEDAVKEYEGLVDKYLKETGKKRDELPHIHFIQNLVPYSKLPSLYKAADCFVLASHGEGWGLPLMEAMSMEVPAIATNWSGNTEFMNDQNSFLVEVESLVPSTTEGHMWAKPDVRSLRSQMRTVFNDRQKAKSIAKLARQHVVSHFGDSNVKQIVVERIQQLLPKLEELKAARASRPQTSWYTTGWSWSAPQSTLGNQWSYFGNNQQTFEENGETRVRIKIND